MCVVVAVVVLFSSFIFIFFFFSEYELLLTRLNEWALTFDYYMEPIEIDKRRYGADWHTAKRRRKRVRKFGHIFTYYIYNIFYNMTMTVVMVLWRFLSTKTNVRTDLWRTFDEWRRVAQRKKNKEREWETEKINNKNIDLIRFVLFLV